jgi:uncharacterized protein (TIRG00374 family)
MATRVGDPEVTADAAPKARHGFRLAMRLVGPALLGWAIWKFADLGMLAETFARGRLGPIVAAVLLNAIAIHAKLSRWRTLLGALDIRVSLAEAYRAFLPSLYLGLITPGRVGDALRIQYLKRDHAVRYADGLAVSVVDRLCDVYVLIAFVALGTVHLARVLSPELLNATIAGAAAVALLPILLLAAPLMKPAVSWIARKLSTSDSGAGDGVDAFAAAIRRQIGSPLWPAFMATTLGFLTNYAQGWLVAQALGIDLTFADTVALIAMSSLLSLLPITISGIGVRESLFALLFPALGLAAGLGVAFGLAVFAVIYLPTLLVGFLAWQAWPPSS